MPTVISSYFISCNSIEEKIEKYRLVLKDWGFNDEDGKECPDCHKTTLWNTHDEGFVDSIGRRVPTSYGVHYYLCMNCKHTHTERY